MHMLIFVFILRRGICLLLDDLSRSHLIEGEFREPYANFREASRVVLR
uniref:Uncharacterized protein n=1 Tax=Arundo donax TaxID=35708 RepID=A0A0A9H7R2_ARUDO